MTQEEIRAIVMADNHITDFQRRVYMALLDVPRGSTITYKELAGRIGCRSAQAVGQALRRNPFAPHVPCHRVIASDGSIGGFSGEREGSMIEKKRRLLAAEQAADGPADLFPQAEEQAPLPLAKQPALIHQALLPPVEQHPLTPFLPVNGRVLMLGSFPPQQKRWCMDFYYPNFTNDMWRVVGLIFFDDPLHFVDVPRRTYRKAAIEQFLTVRGIGLYDTACAVRRLQDNASDKFLEVVTPTNIEALLAKMPQCRTIVTTGQKATDTICEHFGIGQPRTGHFTEFTLLVPWLGERSTTFRLYRMPSTSRAYPLTLAKKAEAYRRMFDDVFA